jgi:hypothetical protein
MSLLATVVRQLQIAEIRCALIGAEALSLRAASRSTLDRDLLTTDRRALETALWQPLIDAGIRCDVRCGDREDPLAGVVRFTAAGERPVDLIVGRHSWQTRIVERSELLDLGDVALPVPPASDLILLKLFAGGGQDAWDVAQLLAGEDRDGVIVEVEQQLAELPAEARLLWERILAS